MKKNEKEFSFFLLLGDCHYLCGGGKGGGGERWLFQIG